MTLLLSLLAEGARRALGPQIPPAMAEGGPSQDLILVYVPHSTHGPAGCPWRVLDGPSAFPYQTAACRGARGKGPLETGLGFC